MTVTHKALIWASAFLLFAAAAATGFVERETAKTMFIVMPALAWVTIYGKGGCTPIKSRRA